MKICIAHFRVGLTDGVSLQIDERARILERFGHKVYFIADTNSPNTDLAIPYFVYKENLKIIKIQEAAFSGKFDTEAQQLLHEVSSEIEKQIEEYWKTTKFTLIFIHNLFSLPVCLPATLAFYNFLKNHPEIKAVGVHHDFWWDPPRLQKFKSNDLYIKKFIKKYFPPKLPNLSHTVLSIWEHKKLLEKRKIKSIIITDTFDFEQKGWNVDETNKNFLQDSGIDKNDLVLLLASRIRPRKGIELGISFTAHLQEQYKNRKVVLVLPNDYSKEELSYISLLVEKAKNLNVRVVWIQHLVGSVEEKKAGIKKYSLWDSYVYADAIIYPSLWEGFGNQFLEAVFAKKPIVTYEYPVFDTDIRPAGFSTINIGDNLSIDANGLAEVDSIRLKKSAGELADLLSDKKRLKSVVDKNYLIGKRKFNTTLQLKDYLSVNSLKYLKNRGLKTIISPLLLQGKLVASGVRFGDAYELAESIISEVPDGGISAEDYFVYVVKRLPEQFRKRFVTIELAKEFLVSQKAKSPLFVFLGGLAGKTSLSNLVVNQLGINQPVAFDNEKYHIADPKKSKSYLWKATYESSSGYIKTVEAIYPYLVEMIERNLFDYKRYKKWCYFWEGIYLSSEIVKKLQKSHSGLYYLSIFILPKFEDVRKQYILRWQEELGVERLKERRNEIDKYLNNVSAIRSHIKQNLDPIASFVIESPLLEERLSAFHAILYQRLSDILDKEAPNWTANVMADPTKLKAFQKWLR